MTTLLVYAPALAHTRDNHPESHRRTAVLWPALNQYGLLQKLTRLSPVPATFEQLRRVHSHGYIEHVRQVCRRGGGLLDQGDTYATEESFDLARLAAGACCRAVDDIMTGKATNGFALIRPPGHHAGVDQASGFCLFNNVALAARHAQATHGAERVLILDIDVHHGNGTQEIFYADASVLFISVHLFTRFFYPGIGSLEEIGVGGGKGFTVNVPLPPYVGDQGYRQLFEQVIRPKSVAFRPDLTLVSIGFDAHWQDPLAMAGLSLTGYAELVKQVAQLAEELTGGRLLFVLEGGYHLDALTYGVLNVLNVLLGKNEVLDPLGLLPHDESDVTELLRLLRRRHLLK